MKAFAVAGPTASGKTSLAIELARRHNGEIVSCDSMQIYRGMDIGTAKPTAQEIAAAPHHLIDILDPDQQFSAAAFVSRAYDACADITSRGRFPVICGGTGLYLEALRDGRFSGVSAPAGDPDFREALRLLSETEEGRARLHRLLCETDPASAEIIHPNNIKRMIRALEIAHMSKLSKSQWDELSKDENEPERVKHRVDLAAVALSFTDRELLYSRIEQRVEEMLAMGLVEEVVALDAKGVFSSDSTASAAIGYKELLPYVRGEATLEKCTETLKTATRRYAKRQITWFGNHEGFTVVSVDDGHGNMKSIESLADEVEAAFGKEAFETGL